MEQDFYLGSSNNLIGTPGSSTSRLQESYDAGFSASRTGDDNNIGDTLSGVVTRNTTGPTLASPPPKRPKSLSRASTLLSSLSPSTSLRLKRVPQATTSTAMPIVVTPPELGQPTTDGSALGQPQDSGNHEPNFSVSKKGQRRFSEASSARPRAGGAIGSAFGSLRKRRGVKSDDSHETHLNIESSTQENHTQSQESIDEKQQEPVTKEAGDEIHVGRRKSIKETLSNIKRLRNRQPATDTFEFAANYLNAGGVAVASPTSVEDGDLGNNLHSLVKGDQDKTAVCHSLGTQLSTYSPTHTLDQSKVRQGWSLFESAGHPEESSSIAMSSHRHHHHHYHDKPRKEVDDDLDLTSVEDVRVPNELLIGVKMLRVDSKDSQKERRFRIDPDQGLLLSDAKKHGIIRVEDIKELRPGSDSRFYIQQFKLPEDYESRWLTISYVTDGKYKTLHVVAESVDSFHSFYKTLLRLRALRMAMVSSPSYPVMAPNPHNVSVPLNSQTHATPVNGHDSRPESVPVQFPSATLSLTHEQRQSLWERHYWKGADFSRDQQLDFKEVQHMARKLSVGLGNKELKDLFSTVDSRHKGSLNFEEFQVLMKALRTRHEIKRLYIKLLDGESTFKFGAFEKFMRIHQQDTRTNEELRDIFSMYAAPEDAKTTPSPSRSRTGSRLSLLSTISSVRVKLSSVYRFSNSSSILGSPVVDHSAENEGECPENPDQQLLKPPDFTQAAPSQESNSLPTPSASLSMTLDGFTTYLMSADNSPFREQNTGISHDMTRPLSEYYISSSHNTYLVGHQLIGESTIEGYIRTLLHSCRSVEIDIWDGDKGPVITHGGTLTSKIPLRIICEAIAKNAFIASAYPVIISAEVHCSVPQQEKIAEIMKECFGEMLVYGPIDGEKKSTESGLLEYLPSPDQLRGRILLKTKNLFLTENAQNGSTLGAVIAETDGGTETMVTSDTEGHAEERRLSVKCHHPRSKSGSSFMSRFSSRQVASSEVNEPDASSDMGLVLQASNGDSHKPIKMSAALANLLVYTVGVKCRGINKKVEYAVEHMFSLSEKTLNKMLKQGSVYYVGELDEDGLGSPEGAKGGMLDLIKHTRNHLVRIYPKATRLRSTNYEPHRCWAAGAQLVALNWQTFDLGYMINYAMFLRNGRSGYVLKPSVLRTKDKRERELITKRTAYCLEIRIISAQQIPLPRNKEGREIVSRSTMDPYVQASVHVPDWPLGPPSILPERNTAQINGNPSNDHKRMGSTGVTNSTQSTESPAPTSARVNETSYNFRSGSTPAKVIRDKTGVVKDNGFNPIWEEDLKLEFEVSGDMLDLVFLKLSVRDEKVDDDEHALGLYCISLGSLKQGYRHLPLHDRQMSQYLFATLFVHINLHKVETP